MSDKVTPPRALRWLRAAAGPDGGAITPPWGAGIALALSLLAAFLTFHSEAHTGLDLNDEGFLWYGTIETSNGSIPVRDFQSYEPGRYYWGALFFRALGDRGIVSLRLSLAAFEAVGLFCALATLRRVVPNAVILAILAFLFAIFVQPRYRVFEFTLPLVAILAGTRLLEAPSQRRCFELGLVTGLCAFFGRNHGAYVLVAAVLVLGLSLEEGTLSLGRRVAAFSGGLASGLSPLLVMAAFVPGFAAALLALVHLNLQTGTQLARVLPVPGVNVGWPRSILGPLPKHFYLAATFCLLPVAYAFGAASLLWGERGPRFAVLASSAIVGSVYLHLAYSRPDPVHLIPAVPPFLILAFALVPGAVAPPLRQGAWLVISFLELQLAANTALNQDPLYLRSVFPFESVKVLGDRLLVPKSEAAVIRLMRALKGTVIQDEDEILVLPDLPALYPILKKRAPLWRLLYVLPETPEREREYVTTLERRKVEFAFVCPWAFDRRADLALPATYPILSSYLEAWETVPETVPGGCVLKERPGPPGAAPPRGAATLRTGAAPPDE
jgi:hypothetical protein